MLIRQAHPLKVRYIIMLNLAHAFRVSTRSTTPMAQHAPLVCHQFNAIDANPSLAFYPDSLNGIVESHVPCFVQFDLFLTGSVSFSPRMTLYDRELSQYTIYD